MDAGFYLLFTRTIFESTAFFVYFAIMPKREKKIKSKSFEQEKELISFMKRESKEDMTIQSPNYEISGVKDNLVIFISYSTKDAERYTINLISEKLLEYDEIKEVLRLHEVLESEFPHKLTVFHQIPPTMLRNELFHFILAFSAKGTEQVIV